MDAVETARRTEHGIERIPSKFMTDAPTYVRGGELGYPGMSFYVVGRGAALGDVPGDVVAAAFGVFHPPTVVDSWESGRSVLPLAEASAEFMACGHRWADAHLGDGPDYGRLADLLGRVIAGVNPMGAPLFAGWRVLPEPGADAPKALVLHRLNVLRELRGGLHVTALLSVGLDPLDAVMVKTPYMAAIFGWPEPHPDASEREPQWQEAQALTDRLMARAFEPLPEDERDELVALLDAVVAAER